MSREWRCSEMELRWSRESRGQKSAPRLSQLQQSRGHVGHVCGRQLCSSIIHHQTTPLLLLLSSPSTPLHLHPHSPLSPLPSISPPSIPRNEQVPRAYPHRPYPRSRRPAPPRAHPARRVPPRPVKDPHLQPQAPGGGCAPIRLLPHCLRPVRSPHLLHAMHSANWPSPTASANSSTFQPSSLVLHSQKRPTVHSTTNSRKPSPRKLVPHSTTPPLPPPRPPPPPPLHPPRCHPLSAPRSPRS